MGGAYNTTKGNAMIYAPEIKNEIKLDENKETMYSKKIQSTKIQS